MSNCTLGACMTFSTKGFFPTFLHYTLMHFLKLTHSSVPSSSISHLNQMNWTMSPYCIPLYPVLRTGWQLISLNSTASRFNLWPRSAQTGSLSDNIKCMAKNFDNNLIFVKHTREISQACFYELRNVSKVRHMLSFKDTEKVAHTVT